MWAGRVPTGVVTVLLLVRDRPASSDEVLRRRLTEATADSPGPRRWARPSRARPSPPTGRRRRLRARDQSHRQPYGSAAVRGRRPHLVGEAFHGAHHGTRAASGERLSRNGEFLVGVLQFDAIDDRFSIGGPQPFQRLFIQRLVLGADGERQWRGRFIDERFGQFRGSRRSRWRIRSRMRFMIAWRR